MFTNGQVNHLTCIQLSCASLPEGKEKAVKAWQNIGMEETQNLGIALCSKFHTVVYCNQVLKMTVKFMIILVCPVTFSSLIKTRPLTQKCCKFYIIHPIEM